MKFNFPDYAQSLMDSRLETKETINSYHMKIDVDYEADFIRDIFESFLNSYRKESINSKCIRIFIKSFSESLKGLEIENIGGLNENIFYKQYDFYNKLDDELRNREYLKSASKLKNYLVAFYRFISNEYIEIHNLQFTNIFMQKINSKNFYKYYEERFSFMYFSILDDVPKEDKICILPNKNIRRNASGRNSRWQSFDFSKCNERYKKDLKIFVWNNYSVGSLNNYLDLVKFLNMSAEKQYFGKIINLLADKDKEFNEEFLWDYRIKVYSENENKNNVKAVFKIVRKYLKYFKEKYNVVNTDIDILSLANLDVYKGGEVITEKDTKLIFQEFKDREKIDSRIKIYRIVFELFISSKLRIGEILNLTRNCLIQTQNGKYEISYLGKMTNQSYKEEIFSEKIINLIKEAIKATDGISPEKSMNKDYIFIERYDSTHNLDAKIINFDYEFRKIIKTLSSKLDKTCYTPNNIRDTFIDNVYTEGIQNDLSIQDISLITGNSYKTANKHYRQRDKMLNYLEAMNRVSIANVDLNGVIIEGNEEQHLEKMNPVKNNLGNCNSDRCDFEIGECLICKNFVTYTSRKKRFEEEIEKVNKHLEEINSEYEMEELMLNRKLLVKFLYEMNLITMKGENEYD